MYGHEPFVAGHPAPTPERFLLIMIGKVKARLVVLLFAAGVLAGCESETVGETQVSSFEGVSAIDRSSGWELGRRGGRFVTSGIGGSPRSFNYAIADDPSAVAILSQMYSTAFKRNQFTLEWEGDLAETWSFSEDELRVTITIRQDLKWSDGEAFTAEDIVFSVNEIHLSDDIGSRHKSGLLVGGVATAWEMVDERTFEIRFPFVSADPFLVASTLYLPEHIFGPIIRDEGIDSFSGSWGADVDPTAVVGNGAFMIDEYRRDESVTMVPNPFYHGADEAGESLPYIDELVYVLAVNREAQVSQFILGELDYLHVSGPDYESLANRQQELGYSLFEVGPAGTADFVAINQNPLEGDDDGGIANPQLTWLSNVEFRKALAHLLDRDRIIRDLQYGLGYPINSFVPSGSPFYWSGLSDAAPIYDPDRARSLLDGLDYIDRDDDGLREDPVGNIITLVLRTNEGNEVRERMIEIFAEDAINAGLDIRTESEHYGVVIDRLVESYDWELIAIGLSTEIDPGLSNMVVPSYGELHMIEPLQESPRRNWEKELDAIWADNQATWDIETRRALLIEAQKIWLEQLPFLYVFSVATVEAYRDGWGNIYPQSLTGSGWSGISDRIYRKSGP